MNTDEDRLDGRLACGADTDELLAQVADGEAEHHSAHQQDCLHCRASLAEYARLWSPVRELAAEQVRAPESLLTEVLRRIRDVAGDPTSGVLAGDRGTTRIAARVVIVTARETAERVPGVRAALSRVPLTGSRQPVAAGVAGASAAIELTVAVQQGYELPVLGERIREAVAGEVRRLTGLEPVAINVIIDDVFAAPEADESAM